MSEDEFDKLERQRRDADTRYNDALTAFDASLVHGTPASTELPTAPPLPPAPSGWSGITLRAAQQWLTPWLEGQHAFNVRTAAAVQALADRERERAAALELFQSSLIAFLQQITAFVETKDRQQTAIATQRLNDHQRLLDEQRPMLQAVPELRAQIAVLQRATAMLKRRAEETPGATAAPPAAGAATTAMPPAAATDSGNDYKYVGFEDQFRGSDESVAAKLRDYLPIFAGATDVVDLGCGRGEFLMTLRSAGITARGVDTNTDMVAVARERGLEVTLNDALTYVAGLPDESIGGAIAAQVVEHLDASYLMRLLDALHRTLRPGAPIVLETINPACWYAFFSSYIRDLTHVHPVHPETLQYLLRASGFERVEIRYREPVPDSMKLKTMALPEDLRVSDEPIAAAISGMARTLDANAALLNRLMFSYMDYAIVGYRS